MKAQHQGVLKTNNCKMILRLLQDKNCKTISRADIAKETGMSPTSITRLIRCLLDLQLVCQEEPFSTGVGRNGIQIVLNKKAFYSVGISFDRDYVQVCIINCIGEIINTGEQELREKKYSPEEALTIAKEILMNICKENEIDMDLIQAYAIACVGNINNQTGYIYFSPQMGWKNIDFAEVIKKVFKKKVLIDNDVKMGLFGATYQFPTLRRSDSVYVSIGAGVGAAVMYDGKLIRGKDNAVGEVGHVHFALNEDRNCVCGRKDCSYTYISTQALLNLCNLDRKHVQNLDELVQAINNKEEWTEKVLNKYINYLVLFLEDIIYMYNPEYLLIGGTVIASHTIFYEKIKEHIENAFINNNMMRRVHLKKRDLKYNAALGAACHATEKYIEDLLNTLE